MFWLVFTRPCLIFPGYFLELCQPIYLLVVLNKINEEQHKRAQYTCFDWCSLEHALYALDIFLDVCQPIFSLLAPAGALYVYMCQFSVCASGNQLLKMSTSVIDETNKKGTSLYSATTTKMQQLSNTPKMQFFKT